MDNDRFEDELERTKEAIADDLKLNAAVPLLKTIRSAPSFFIMIAAALLMVFVTVFTVVKIAPAYFRADSVGTNIGNKLGDAVGWAVGSFNGMTSGNKEGREAGKTEGLSAKDTSVVIANTIKETGKLEVLAAGIKITNLEKVGNNDYSALYLVKGTAVFSVNLTKADVSFNDDFSTVEVKVPDVNASIYIDNGETEILAQYQKSKFTGSAKDGFTAFINSANQTSNKTAESIENYDMLKKSAQTSAEKQITSIIKSYNSRIADIKVTFGKEAE